MRRGPAPYGTWTARVALLLAGALLLAPRDSAAAQSRTTPAPATNPLVSQAQRRGIERGLAWIAAAQQPGGHWGEEEGTKIADTALSVLALMAGGNTVGPGRAIRGPDGEIRAQGPPQLRGPYARQVLEGVRYLARKAWEDVPGRPKGYIQDDKVSRMHGHGFATLALAEACGPLGGGDIAAIRRRLAQDGVDASQLSLSDQVRYGLQRAVDLTERAQDPDSGGWLYDPYPNGHEGSMTVTQIAALRAAQDVGVSVSGVVLRRACQYVRDSQVLESRELYGGFAYQKNARGRVSYALTAAALTTFFGLGRYGIEKDDATLIERGMNYLDDHFDEALHDTQWFYYGLFYGAQAIYQDDNPRRLSQQWPRLRDRVLREQNADGSFDPVNNDRSREYATAMGCLILQVPLETLPIFQRH